MRIGRYIAKPDDPDQARGLRVPFVAYREVVLNGSAIPPQVDR